MFSIVLYQYCTYTCSLEKTDLSQYYIVLFLENLNGVNTNSILYLVLGNDLVVTQY